MLFQTTCMEWDGLFLSVGSVIACEPTIGSHKYSSKVHITSKRHKTVHF